MISNHLLKPKSCTYQDQIPRTNTCLLFFNYFFQYQSVKFRAFPMDMWLIKDLQSMEVTLISVVDYHCNNGFSRYGTQSRTCQSSENWSGQKPDCKRKNYLFKQMWQIKKLNNLILRVHMYILKEHVHFWRRKVPSEYKSLLFL